ncbi:USP15 [Mytilus edulis]|uniref:USP15 n=1 Tax=Mytilus edulis TaxID=6550 RepID=A0A8S3UV02_MYTED|nr:USP15 [Mytilus edulis]
MFKHDELLLGLRDQGLKFPVTDFSTRQIAVLGVDYKRKATFEYDENGRKLFNYAFRIISDSENNIYVLDLINDGGHGRVVGFGYERKKKFVYNGYSILNTPDTPFFPGDIAITPKNILLITDIYNHAMHAINANGEMLDYKVQKILEYVFHVVYHLILKGFLLIGSEPDEEETKSTS